MGRYNQGFRYEKRIRTEDAGRQVIEYLALRYPAFNREQWLERIHSGRVLLDGVPAQEDRQLSAGQLLTWMRPPWEEPEVPRCYAILYRDDCLVAVAKPSGLPTIPGGGFFIENTLLTLVRGHFPEASPLHRLGRGTSGIVLFALSHAAAGNVLESWRSSRVLKVYRALAAGSPEQEAFTVDAPIGPVPHPVLKTVFGATSEGKAAHSEVKVLERRPCGALVEVRITTGRPHQIRIHLAAAGFPLVGDPLYGRGGIPAQDTRALPSDLGYFLHNGFLAFPHPATGKWTEINCCPPPVLRLALAPGGPAL